MWMKGSRLRWLALVELKKSYQMKTPTTTATGLNASRGRSTGRPWAPRSAGEPATLSFRRRGGAGCPVAPTIRFQHNSHHTDSDHRGNLAKSVCVGNHIKVNVTTQVARVKFPSHS